jgi:pectate lyase
MSLTAKGPGTVVFRVTDTIEGRLKLKNGSIIAGHSAPGEGVCIKGSLTMGANDVIKPTRP